MRKMPLHATLIATAAAALMLSACGRNDDRTAGQQLDQAVASAETRADQARADVKQGMAEARESARETGAEIKAGASRAADAVADKVEDAAITASVNAELAKDDRLSALKINVDTSGGHVSLRGTAPDASARERATRLASSVKGVVSVDNQLEVRG
ncbi:BON domain-containing protein [Piscinibacter sakaiensis]|uniref:Putative periplasmic protein n=1 Tax=Piscinibacter sakaiensis TaxID=1547922 RepID=A0A0K8NY76_PISS1|nr:BON domain-containing protein [Piscinibacter sakaiensis]GAP35239.1 putative periplasmic protein [Piscinibacter sakaiensis]